MKVTRIDIYQFQIFFSFVNVLLKKKNINMKYKIRRRKDLLENSFELVCKCFLQPLYFKSSKRSQTVSTKSSLERSETRVRIHFARVKVPRLVLPLYDRKKTFCG